MRNQEPLRDRVAKWLAGEGYPLEMRVAAAFRQIDLWVRQSSHYVDGETGKSREIDVIGTHAEQLGMAEIHFVVECKATTKPWVLLTSAHTLNSFNRLFALGISSDRARGALSEKIPVLSSSLRWFRKDDRIGYNLTEAFASGADVPYGAAVAVTKACLSLLNHTGRLHKPPLIFTFPAIVIESPLFECFLSDDGQMTVAEIDDGWLFLDARLPGFLGTCIRVVSRAALPQFCAEIREIKTSLDELIADDVQREWKELVAERNYLGNT